MNKLKKYNLNSKESEKLIQTTSMTKIKKITAEEPKKYKVGVVGIGRVGLPLALSLQSKGVECIGFDVNQETIDKVNKKKMPFFETGYDELIKKLKFEATNDFKKIKDVDNLIITVGTPLLQHIETDLTQINKVLDSVIPHLRKGHCLILRSTVALNTTTYIKKTIESKTKFVVGRDVMLGFCPERVVEGKVMEELETLPQIIGTEDAESAKRAEEIFSFLTKKIFHTNYINAELTKLFNNIYRYITFAVSNELAMIAENAGANVFEVLKLTNTDYPRGGIPKPGFTAGTCLRKDFGMINENTAHSDLLLNAWKVNEFLPKYLVDKLKEKKDLNNRVVGVLGYTFKKDSDDTRDTLALKLIRYIEREVPTKVLVHEPHLKGKLDDKLINSPLERVCEESDIVFVATNHSEFRDNSKEIIKNLKSECIIVDIWNIFGMHKIYFTKNDYEKNGQ